MSGRTITLLTDESSRMEGQRLATAVLGAWPPFADSPELQPLTMREALADPDRIVGAATLAVVEDSRGSMIQRLVDHLEPRLTPLVIIPESTDAGANAMGRGVLVAPRTAAPGAIAAMLHALLQRQPLIDELQGELRMSQRFQGGLRQEMSKMHEEMQLAGRVQREFLPASLPTFDGMQFEVFFRPCGYVSGDIYDVVRLDDHRAGFVLADAVGHGVPAALMTMVLTRALPMIAAGGPDGRPVEPCEALSLLNETLIRGQAGSGRFATAVYGVVDSRTRTVTIAGAGHPAPLRISPRGLDRVETEGPLLGVFPDAVFEQVSITLDDDEILLIYSDGFETAFPGAEEVDLDRRMPSEEFLPHFRAVAESQIDRGLTQAVKELGAAIDLQSGSLHQIDDLTAMVLAPTALAAEKTGSVEARSAA